MSQNKRINLMRWMQGDIVIWMVFIFLCMISVVEVYSASSTMSYGGKSHYWEPIVQHATYWGGGLLLALLVSIAPCNYFKLGSVFGFLFALGLQVVALCSGSINGAGRWIHLWNVTFQPSELTKVMLVLYVSFIYASMRDSKGVTSLGNKFALLGVGAALGLIVTENLSTALLILAVMIALAVVAQVRLRSLAWMVVPIALLGSAGWVGARSLSEDTLQGLATSDFKVLHRVPTWVHRMTDKHELPADPKDYDITDNVQVTHARIAVASSHLIGKGPGKSRQRDYLPQAYSDFIYAIIIEEFGLAGAAIVMSLYLIFMWRCRLIAARCKYLFPSYLVMGLSLMIVTQALVNMGVAVGALPVTGQTLPLISRGGSSLVINGLCIGMILSVSRSAKRIDDPVSPPMPVRDDAQNVAAQPA